MKEWLRQLCKVLSAPAAIILMLPATGCNNKKAETVAIHDHHVHTSEGDIYTCPMHPEIRQKEPGICPVCKMDLVKPGDSANASRPMAGLVLDPTNRSVLASVKTVSADSMTVQPHVEVHGKIEFDPREIRNIPANFRGRIERLYIRYNYQPVKKGEPLFEIFSEELLNAQENYLFLLKSDQGAKSLIQAAEEKLRLLGMTDLQIKNLIRSGKGNSRITLYSPVSGIVVEKGKKPRKSSGEPGVSGMNNMQPSAMEEQNLTVAEGDYISRGQNLFTIVPFERLWAVLEVHATEAGLIRCGLKMKLKPSAGDSIFTQVDFIDPDVNEGKNMQVRAYLRNNKGQLLVNDLLSGTIEADSIRGMFLPASAVLDLGDREVVFVREKEGFEAKPVKTGIISGNKIQILKGLSPREEVAGNAAFLIDSESFIRTEEK